MDARILLVEDDAELVEFMKMVFEREKYHVITAMDGLSALEKARNEHPDIVLLDVLLPKMNGYEVCDKLRQDPVTCLLPIMMVTSLTALKDRVTGIKLGADQFVSKPFEPVELLARVERLIHQTRRNVAADPLTGLAGTGALEQEIRRRLSDKESFSVAQCDLKHFNRFNEQYGFERGDGVLRLVATIMRSAIAELGNADDIAVHLGSDDFAFLSTTSRGAVVCARILENMESLIPMQYNDEERAKILAANKTEKSDTSFIPLSIGLVDVVPGLYQHYAQIMDRCRAALAEAKKQPGAQMVKLT